MSGVVVRDRRSKGSKPSLFISRIPHLFNNDKQHIGGIDRGTIARTSTKWKFVRLLSFLICFSLLLVSFSSSLIIVLPQFLLAIHHYDYHDVHTTQVEQPISSPNTTSKADSLTIEIPKVQYSPMNDSEYGDDDGHTRVNMMGGCVGSNAVNNFLYLLLHGHGVPVHDFRNNPEERVGCNRRYECNNFELMKYHRIPLREKMNVRDVPLNIISSGDRFEKTMEALWELKEDLSQKNEVLMVKAGGKKLDIFRDKFNASFTHVVRRNVLDTLICEVKDCFRGEQHVGYSLFENGTRSDICFARRKLDPSIKMLVHLDPELLISELEHEEKKRRRLHKQAKQLMYPSVPQTYEDIFEYEYTSDEDSFQKSLKAWIQTIEPLVKSVRPDIVESYMRPMQNTRPPPKNHIDMIQNFDEVYSAMKMASKLHYLRH